MAKRWGENTAAGPRLIGGKLCQKAEGNWVDDGPLTTSSESVTYDSQRRIASYTEGGITKTVIYNGDGTVASYQ